MDRHLVNFSWVREQQLAGSAYPSPAACAAMAEAGVGALLTLTERPLGEVEGLVQHHEPWPDFGTPGLDQLARCVAWIDAQLAAGRPVAVHCLAGMGRTGTVLAAWLIAHGLSADEALAEVRARRPGSVETRGQERALHEFAAARAAGKSLESDG